MRKSVQDCSLEPPVHRFVLPAFNPMKREPVTEVLGRTTRHGDQITTVTKSMMFAALLLHLGNGSPQIRCNVINWDTNRQELC
jgi:hypothetical protein